MRLLKFIIIFFLFPLVSFSQTPSLNASIRAQASVNTSTPSITLNWVSGQSATGYIIHRKLKTSTNWGSPISNLGGSVQQFVDLNVLPNEYYEYRITRNSSSGTHYTYIGSALNLISPEYKGKLILVVDDLFSSTLSNRIDTLILDIRGDGWDVIRIDVSRNSTPISVRSQIQGIYNSDPNNVKSVLLLGHIPVYRSGNISPDGHSSIPWASDAFYGEMTSSWSSPLTSLPSDVELEVGRIDLFNLPAFGLSELQLLSNYLDKLHDFKMKEFTPQNRMLVQDNLNWVSNPIAETAYRVSGPLVGLNNLTNIPPYNSPNWGSRMTEGWLWGYASGGGNYISADGIGGTTTLVNSPCNIIFNMMAGSYFGNWDCSTSVPLWNNNTNNFMRSALASGQALTNIYSGLPNLFLHHMGMGDNIGYSVRLSMNNRTSNALYQPQNGGWQGQGYTTIHIGLMGDPTLRQSYVKPPTNFEITRSVNLTNFSWTPVIGVDGYNIYDITSGTPQKINTSIINESQFSANNLSGVEYMVRSVKTETSFSGIYSNYSIGKISNVTIGEIPFIVKAFLNGPFNGVDMKDSLRTLGMIPTNEPYTSLGYVYVNNSEPLSIQSSMFSISGSNAPVDWVIIELRDMNNPSIIIQSFPCIITKSGFVVRSNGQSLITSNSGSFYIAIKHRNHLGLMTDSPINLSGNPTIDFSINIVWGEESGVFINSKRTMWPGNCNFDNLIKYVGQGNDRDLILSRIGGSVPTNTIGGYYPEDVNMDGIIRYTGNNNDRDVILLTIGGSTPTNIVVEQIP